MHAGGAKGLIGMRPRDRYGEGGHGRSGGRFDLFYYERVGERYYLRLTPLAAALVIGLTLLSIAGIVLFYFYNSGRARRPIDVNIRVADPPAVPATQSTIIVPAKPPPQPPRVVAPTPKSMKGGTGGSVGPTPIPSPNTEATPVKTPPAP
jgi:hypothetical protein